MEGCKGVHITAALWQEGQVVLADRFVLGRCVPAAAACHLALMQQLPLHAALAASERDQEEEENIRKGPCLRGGCG
jgi:hypothetical protein